MEGTISSSNVPLNTTSLRKLSPNSPVKFDLFLNLYISQKVEIPGHFQEAEPWS